jgi:hypothetical protein
MNLRELQLPNNEERKYFLNFIMQILLIRSGISPKGGERNEISAILLFLCVSFRDVAKCKMLSEAREEEGKKHNITQHKSDIGN